MDCDHANAANKQRDVPRVNDLRVFNGIFWILRFGEPWRDLPDNFGPYTTHYNRFVQRPERALMERLPDSLAIAFWLVGSCWLLAIIAYVLDASMEWMLPRFMLGLVTGLAEWVMRRTTR